MILFAACSSSSAKSPGSATTAVPTPGAPIPVPATAVPVRPTSAPPAPTADPRALESQLDAAWANSDWPQAVVTLEQLRKLTPEPNQWTEKLYAVYMFDAQAFLAKGDPKMALSQLGRAVALNPARGEAKALIQQIEARQAADAAAAQATATAQAQATASTQARAAAEAARAKKTAAVYLDPRELAADPKAFVGRNIFLQGKTLNVDHNDAKGTEPS